MLMGPSFEEAVFQLIQIFSRLETCNATAERQPTNYFEPWKSKEIVGKRVENRSQCNQQVI